MKMRDLKIGTQMTIGLTVIIVLGMGYGGHALYQSDRIWAQTKGLYDHPLQVRQATGRLTLDVIQIYQSMQNLVTARDQTVISDSTHAMAEMEVDVARQIQILEDRYLGPKSDLDNLKVALARWREIRAETVRLMTVGEFEKAAARVMRGGVGGQQVSKLLGLLSEVSDFAAARADLFFKDAKSHRDAMRLVLMIMSIVMILITAVTSHLLVRSIKRPLREFTEAARQFGSGKLDTRVNYQSANEFGVLAGALNYLASNVQAGIDVSSKISRVSDAIVRPQEVSPFCIGLLTSMMRETDSQVGAVYVANRGRTEFELVESIGLGAGCVKSFSSVAREGELGAALASRSIHRIKDIPVDSQFLLRTVSGDIKPREIVTIPVESNGEIVAVVSLASVKTYSDTAIRLIESVQDVVAARFAGVLTLQQVREFSQKLDVQNRELEAQKNELERQADEVSAQNMELEQQKRQLDQANRLKTSFLSNMSHELRTPLNSVIALSGVLGDRLRGSIPEQEYGYLEVIERNGRSLLGLLNDILDLSRIEAGAEELDISSFGVRDLVCEVVDMIEPLVGEKDVRVINSVPAELPHLVSDALKVRHIIQNLVGNAVKFTAEGHVEISARTVDKCVEISVADTGIGISAEHLPFIFDEFRQAEEGTARRFGGTGLGLSIARKYANLLKGGLTVESTPGKGSTFTLRLPLEVFSSACSKVEDVKVPGRRDLVASPYGGGRKILVVEDSEAAIIQVRDMLTGHGYVVTVARNGREALEQIDKSLPDAMILDLMMPEVDGFAVLKAIRSVEATANIPVLILTAKHVTKEELSFLKSNHIHQLIQKGDVNKADLLNSIAGMVGLKGSTPEVHRDSIDKGRRSAGLSYQAAASGKPVILVVEDNPDNLKTVRALLSDIATIIEASDGEAGVAQAQVKMPDLILMDISLPFMDGFKALDEIRKEKFLQHVPVIAVTARAMKGDREEMLAYGFDGYVSKPIDGKVLRDTIRELLSGKC